MIYRLILKIDYIERAFDFDDFEDVSQFADTILTHDIPDDRDMSIIIKGIKEVSVNTEEENKCEE